MKNAFSKLVELFTRNWGLKILALLLAIVIYHSLKPSENRLSENGGSKHDRSLFQSR